MTGKNIDVKRKAIIAKMVQWPIQFSSSVEVI